MSDSPMVGPRWTRLAEDAPPAELRTDVPHSARVYDYYLGGKDNFPADREAAERVAKIYPDIVLYARQNRAFMAKAARYLAGEAGIRQFLDIGTGIPTSPNLHEIVQGVAPAARVVYIDNDPVVLAHARALLTSTPEGRTAYLDADLRDPERILASPELLGTLDLTRPVALFLTGILHFVVNEDDPHRIVRRLMEALPSGSCLTLTHGTNDFAGKQTETGSDTFRKDGLPNQGRTGEEVARFFDGLDLVAPGIVPLHRWRPDGTADDLTDAQVSAYAGIAIKK